MVLNYISIIIYNVQSGVGRSCLSHPYYIDRLLKWIELRVVSYITSVNLI